MKAIAVGAESMESHRLLCGREHGEERADDAGVPAGFDGPGLRLAVAEDLGPVAGGG